MSMCWCHLIATTMITYTAMEGIHIENSIYIQRNRASAFRSQDDREVPMNDLHRCNVMCCDAWN